MTTQLDIYLDYINSQKEKQKFEEDNFIYSDDLVNNKDSYNSDFYNRGQQRQQVPEIPQQQDSVGKQSVAELRRSQDFNTVANRFLEGMGSNEDIFEYLRDSDYSLSSALVRSFQTGNWTEQQKKDYVYLKNKFDNADVKTFREKLIAAKDIGVDILADPLNILGLFLIPLTGGASAVGATALKTGLTGTAKQGLRRLVKGSSTKQLGLLGAGEGAAWGGAHNYALQDIDVDLGLKGSVDLSDLGLSTLLGGGIGGAVGAASGALSSRYLKFKDKAEEEVANRVNKDMDAVPVSDAPEQTQQLVFNFSNETAIDEATEFVTRKEIVEKSRVESVANKKTNNISQAKNSFISTFFGKPTTKFLNWAKDSEKLDELLSKFRYDYDVGVFKKGKEGVRKKSYGLALGERQGKYLYELQKSLNNVGRVGFRAKLNKEDESALLFLLRDSNVVSTKEKAVRGKVWIKDLINSKYKNVDVSEDVAIAFGGTKFNGQDGIRNLLDNTFDDIQGAGLFRRGTKNTGGFFPRNFNYKKLKDNREKFKEILIKSGHADPINEIPTVEIIEATTNKKLRGVLSDAVGKDESVFGIDFLKAAKNNIAQAQSDKADMIIDNMLANRFGSQFDINVNYGRIGGSKDVGDSSSFLVARRFTNISDNEIAFVLEDNLESTLQDYFTHAARNIEKKKFFGSNRAEFFDNYIIPIREELKTSGIKEDEIKKVTENLMKMHDVVAGYNVGSASNLVKSPIGRFGADFIKVTQQLAHLPFATLSSLTEPLILLSRAHLADSPLVVKDIAVGVTKGIESVLDRSWKGLKRGVGRRKIKGIKDLDDETWGELYKTGLALEQSVQERIEGLAGEGIRGSGFRAVQQGFFKLNLLTQWTKSVQLASFTTGKRLIKRNAEQLAKGKTVVGRKLTKSNRKYLVKQLNELGIDENDAISWYKGSLRNGKFDETLSRKSPFYEEQYVSGANRFTKEIILNPSSAEANRPLMFGTPAAQLLIQFAGYPTVFNNTVLKRFVNEAVANNPIQAMPKLMPTVILMTGVAHMMNTIRSNGQNLRDYETRVRKPEGELVLEAVRRFGGLGPFDYAYRYGEVDERNMGDITELAKATLGPGPQDVIDAFLYRRDIPEIVVTNLPGYGALPADVRRELRASARGKKVNNKALRYNYARGGIVLNVPNVKDEPDEMISRVTKQPFNESSESVQDVEDRELKAQMKSLGL